MLGLLLSCSVDFGGDSPPPGGTGVFDDDDDGDFDCCAPHAQGGCGNILVADCVCEAEPACCESAWSQACVDRVESAGCGQCAGAGSCCEAGPQPGCDTPTVQACVCAIDEICCTEAWDEQCVANVILLECGQCVGANSCFVADGEPGCAEPDLQACVCAQRPQCCGIAWDFACVDAIETLGCERGTTQ